MPEPDLRLRLYRNPPANCIDVYVVEMQEGRGLVAYGQHVTLYHPGPEEEGYQIDRTFSLREEGAQHLIDELWREGFRPSKAPSGEALMEALQAHIKDLRSAHDVLLKIAERRK